MIHSTARACNSPIGKVQLWSQDRLPLFDLVEHVPREAPGPAPAAQHFVPVAFDRPMDLLQGTKVSRNAIIGVMAPQCGVESVDLFSDRPVPDSSQQVLQRHETAPQARFLGAHSHPEVALQVPRAVEREPQKIDRLWALPAVFGGMSLREPARGLKKADTPRGMSASLLSAKWLVAVHPTHSAARRHCG